MHVYPCTHAHTFRTPLTHTHTRGQEQHNARERALRDQAASVLKQRAEEAERRLSEERSRWADQFREHSEKLHSDLSAAEEARDGARLRAEEAEAAAERAREEAQNEVARLRDSHSRVLQRMQGEHEDQIAAIREMCGARRGAVPGNKGRVFPHWRETRVAASCPPAACDGPSSPLCVGNKARAWPLTRRIGAGWRGSGASTKHERKS